MRIDLSEYLFHWVKGESTEKAFRNFVQVFNTGYIVPSSKYIKGGHEVVCFTETPAKIFHSANSDYAEFGFAFKKQFLFDLGARPVIYQPRDEDSLIDPSIHWRVVTFDIRSETGGYLNRPGFRGGYLV